jgi:hypothetical protein
MKLKRIAAVAGLVLAVGVGGVGTAAASGVPDENANCVGVLDNYGGTQGGSVHGLAVAAIAQGAFGGTGVGQFTGPAASTNCGAGQP